MTNQTMKPVNGAPKSVTMKDVAQRAGVHHASVSVVLNGSKSSAGVSQSARERILQAAEELGYRRNGSAHTIRTGRFGSLALLLSTQRGNSYLPAPLLGGLHESLARQDMSLTVWSLPDEELNDSGVLPKILRERMSDGLLIDYNKRIPASMVATIERHQIPAVWINSKRETFSVHPDDFGAGSAATRSLLELGHRRIAYVDLATPYPDDPQQHYSRVDRRSGYMAAMAEAGLPAVMWDANITGPDQIGFCKEALKSSDRPTAVVAYATWTMEALTYAAISLGFDLPDDLSIVTFGPEQIEHMCQMMTMFIEPQYEIAQLATKMLLERIENPTQELGTKAVPFTFESGQSAVPLVDILGKNSVLTQPESRKTDIQALL